MGADIAGQIPPIPMSPLLGQTLTRAAEYAQQQSHDEVALEHLLLALTEDDSARQVMESSGVDIAALQTDVSQHIGRIEQRIPPGERPTSKISEELRRILNAAAIAARAGRRNSIDGAIVLAAIIGDAKTSAAGLLRAHGLTFEVAIDAIRQVARNPASPPPQAPQGQMPEPAATEDVPPPENAPPPQANEILANARARVASRRAAGYSDQHTKGEPAAGEPPPAEGVPNEPAPPAAAPEGNDDQATPAASQTPAKSDADTLSADLNALIVAASSKTPNDRTVAQTSFERVSDENPLQPPKPPPAVRAPAPPPPPPQKEDAPPPPAPTPPPSAEEQLEIDPPALRPTPPQPAPIRDEQPAPPPPGPAAPPVPPPRPPSSETADKAAAAPAKPDDTPAPPRQPSWTPPPVGDGRTGPPPQPPRGAPPPMPPNAPMRPPVPGSGPSPGAGPVTGSPPRREGGWAPPPGPPGQSVAPDPRGAGQPRPPGAPLPSPDEVFGQRQRPAGSPPPREALEPARQTRPSDAMLERMPQPTLAGGPPPSAAPAARRTLEPPTVLPGQLVENVPRRMRVGISSPVEVRIAKAEVKAISEGLDMGNVHRHEIQVTKAMSVRLRAPEGGFFIETASPETQWIENALGLMADDYARWRWNVTPKVRGKRRLQLVISARTVGPDGLAAETALPDQVIEIKVATNYATVFKRVAGWAIAAVLGGLLAQFGAKIWTAVDPLMKSLMQ